MLDLREAVLLSIVIPTKDRYETLVPLVIALLKWNSEDFEIVIQDNSTNNKSFSSFLADSNDDRIKYFYEGSCLSAIENCDLAVSWSNGRYVCFIGDDDGLSFKIIELCMWMLSNEIESAYFNTGLYTWPDSEHYLAINNAYNAKLVLPSFTGNILKVDLDLEYKKVFLSGGQSMYKIPRVYHGVVLKECLDKLKSQTGTYFPGPVPDMSNAIGLFGKVTRHYYVDLPLIISGHSKKSMSGRNSRRDHQNEIANERSLPKDTIYNWNRFIPFFWSGPTIWAQACTESIERVGHKIMLENFKYYKLYAACYVFCSRSYYSRITRSMFNGRNVLQVAFLTLMTSFRVIQIVGLRILNFLLKKLRGINGYPAVNIIFAIETLESLLTTREKSKICDNQIVEFE
jgi:glycosyltransferase involved in cell wall biosynthesis